MKDKQSQNRRVLVMAVVGAVLLVAVLGFKVLSGSGSGSSPTTPPPPPVAAAGAGAAGAAVAATPHHVASATATTLPTSGSPRDPFSP